MYRMLIGGAEALFIVGGAFGWGYRFGVTTERQRNLEATEARENAAQAVPDAANQQIRDLLAERRQLQAQITELERENESNPDLPRTTADELQRLKFRWDQRRGIATNGD